ncbi:hypothetical protein NM208_g4428 [Fusarium decemcellulare]|uniref:Uncharacterized protein n=1 Tax=Fusarium decemcellulare TaxID=57161 RepID=A0ACC1SKU4_9HYPO|nr:hypothetical protein NM208_g4428 [Fusarium decemcellulare]
MRCNLPALAVCLLLSQLVTARRGGGGDSGGSSGGGGDSGGGSSGGGGSGGAGGMPADQASLPDGLNHDLSCPLGTCGCQQLNERMMLYGLPGIYYNGTITVRHEIKESTAWNDKGASACGNNDEAAKTYKYPALFLAAPRGNASDTNPFHWVLYGFQPEDQTTVQPGPQVPYLDVLQRWIQIRSSDFVLSGTSYGGAWTFRGQDALYRNSDATDMHQQTRVYWETNITDWKDDQFSARAVYTQLPPPPDLIIVKDGDEKRNSQYVTLSNVCAWNQTNHLENLYPLPRSEIPNDDDFVNTTTPTLWLTRGATAEMKDIGAESMTFSLNHTLQSARVYAGQRKAACGKGDEVSGEVFERSVFQDLYPYREFDDNWKLEVSIDLSFEGDIVSENSTSVTGRDNGDVVFKAAYETPKPSEGSTGSSSSGSSLTETLGAVIWTVTLLTVTLIAYVA